MHLNISAYWLPLVNNNTVTIINSDNTYYYDYDFDYYYLIIIDDLQLKNPCISTLTIMLSIV